MMHNFEAAKPRTKCTRNVTVDLIEFGVLSDVDDNCCLCAKGSTPLVRIESHHGMAPNTTDVPVTFRRSAAGGEEYTASSSPPAAVDEGLMECVSPAKRSHVSQIPFASTPPPISVEQRNEARGRRKLTRTGLDNPISRATKPGYHPTANASWVGENGTFVTGRRVSRNSGDPPSRQHHQPESDVDSTPSHTAPWQRLLHVEPGTSPRAGTTNLKNREMELQSFSNRDPYWASSTTPADVGKPDAAVSGCLANCGLLRVLLDKPFLTALFVFIPIGFLSNYYKWPDYVTFWTNFVAVIPQAWLMGKATEDLAAHMGQVTGGLLNAWFGNVVEMLLCIAGLRAGQLIVVKATLVGSILSNLLLVTGCSFLFGGLKHKVQEFSAIGASTNASLMTLSCLCLGLPTMYATINTSAVTSELNISRATSFLLVFIYAQYLIFQLGTHSFLFEEGEDEEAEMSITTSALTLGFCTAACTFSSEFLIHSIEGTVDTLRISKSFIGIILLPIIGNAAEHYTSVIVAVKNKMDLSLACAVGSSCQMALFVTPFTVLVGWSIGQPMSLDLNAFEMLVLVLAVLILTSILQDGYSHWLEGSMLLSAYLVIALIYFFEDPN